MSMWKVTMCDGTVYERAKIQGADNGGGTLNLHLRDVDTWHWIGAVSTEDIQSLERVED